MVEWDKDDLDAVGILIVDILALGMLSCLRRASGSSKTTMAGATRWRAIVTAAASRWRRSTKGCAGLRHDLPGRHARRVQIESRAQMSMLPRLDPAFYDLVIRGGDRAARPIQGDMVHPYLPPAEEGGRQLSQPRIEAILKRTLRRAALPGTGDEDRHRCGRLLAGRGGPAAPAMATFRRNGTIGNYRHRMIEGMVGRGYARDFASAASSRSRVSASMASPKATRHPSHCSSTPRAGSRPSIPTSSCAAI